ncbi:hypothetical protein [Sphingomonas sp. BE137]|uniref:hypothetical protein n=1 Tax=Sphingomonas sp. BE137 TaxID=2817844 RepID=UPI001AE7D4B8|nr:hypothetical protein [Sphingomonas sp. BE137]MDR6850360.1 hypothetical protein [Sphingomonas sp. BE137]
MTMMSLTAYADTHASSRQAATKWRDRGYVVMIDDKVDVEASDAKMQAAAKGRFRVKAHGGRRTTGERGVIDRPGLGYVGGAEVGLPAPPAAEPDPWKGWHRLGNPNTASDGMRQLLAIGDDEAIDDMLDHLDFRDWEEACTMAGWFQWVGTASPQIAKDLGIADARAVEKVLRAHVLARLAALEVDEADISDPRLKPR